MSCDIHPYVEIYNEATDTWHVSANFPYAGPWDSTKQSEFNEKNKVSWEPFSWDKEDESPFRKIRNRNYGVFTILADVRNYGEVTPMCNPKGLPEDISVWALRELEPENLDIHSRSWHTFDDLLEVWENYKGTEAEEYIGKFFEGIESIRNDFSTIPASHIRLVFGFDN